MIDFRYHHSIIIVVIIRRNKFKLLLIVKFFLNVLSIITLYMIHRSCTHEICKNSGHIAWHDIYPNHAFDNQNHIYWHYFGHLTMHNVYELYTYTPETKPWGNPIIFAFIECIFKCFRDNFAQITCVDMPL